MSDKLPKQMKGFERKTTESAPYHRRVRQRHIQTVIFLYMIGIHNICIVYFIWASKVSELRPSEPRIILLAESGDLDNHNAARRRNG